ncbi:MAG: ATP-binding protein [Desulfobacula sp.]|jgi:signal transduction histidine kinase/ActR/RegA family two-component response regulator
MLRKIQLFWRDSGITQKLTLAFGSLMASILIIFALCIFLLNYSLKEKEESFFFIRQISDMVLSLNWKIEASRGLEKDFFIQYPKAGYTRAYNEYAGPSRDLIRQMEAITAGLQQLLEKSRFRQEKDINLELLLMAQERHAKTLNEAVDAVSKLIHPEIGIEPVLSDTLSLLGETLLPGSDPGIVTLFLKLQTLHHDYLLKRKRPVMQSSFNVIAKLRDRIPSDSHLTDIQKSNVLACLDKYVSTGEKIIETDAVLDQKIREFKLQENTLNEVTDKMVRFTNQETEFLQEKTNRLSNLIKGFMVAATIVSLGFIWSVSRLIGNSITSNIIKLSKAATEVKNGNLDTQIHINSRDELGNLAGDMNSMTFRIKGLVNNLEQMIIDRTRSLDHTNEQLKIEILERKKTEESLRASLSERKQAEMEKISLESRLRQAQKMEAIGTLAGGIAHDFNNILFPIIGYTEMLMEDFSENDPVRNSLNEIYTSTLRARDLVKQILTFARQEKNDLKLMKIQPIIKEALKLIRSSIPATIVISQNLQPDCGPVKAEPTQIHQIVLNLSTNAYHAMEANGGELKVNLKEIKLGPYDLVNTDITPGPYACLTVTDTGLGMNKDIVDRIFEPFFTTKEKGKGTGMGLSVVHGIVKAMNGAIKVYSEPGRGTEFRVYLPIIENISEKQSFLVEEPITGGTERILLVDDEEAILTMEKQSLVRLGYHVTSRTGSIEAFEAFHTNPDRFDLVITDMSMPKMPGDKLAVELIKIRPEIPILLCTGFSEAMTAEKIKSLGIRALLMKPVAIRELAKKIREVLDGSKKV